MLLVPLTPVPTFPSSLICAGFLWGLLCLYAHQNPVLGVVVARASWGFQAHLDVPERAGECWPSRQMPLPW